jgi:hypothetical protein
VKTEHENVMKMIGHVKTPMFECPPTGRLTYRQLLEKLKCFSDEQLDSDVTVEDPFDNECYAGELKICGEDHDSLDDFHPVISII